MVQSGAITGVQAAAGGMFQWADRFVGDGKLTNGRLVQTVFSWNGVAVVIAISALVLAKSAVGSPQSVKLSTDDHVKEDRRNRYWIQAVTIALVLFLGVFVGQRHLPNYFIASAA